MENSKNNFPKYRHVDPFDYVQGRLCGGISQALKPGSYFDTVTISTLRSILYC